MSDFTYYNRMEDDGYEQTNRLENIEDQQCDVCLKTLVSDWHIQESFKMTDGLHAICFSCSNESAQKLQELVKERIVNPKSDDYDLSTTFILQSLLDESKIIDKS